MSEIINFEPIDDQMLLARNGRPNDPAIADQILSALEDGRERFILFRHAPRDATYNNHPRAANGWHFDNHRAIGIVNPFERVFRGPTLWMPNAKAIGCFRGMLHEIPRESERMGGWIDRIERGDEDEVRKAIKKLSIHVNLRALNGDSSAQRIQALIDESTRPYARAIDWNEHPCSTIFFSDALGMHRSSDSLSPDTPKFKRILIERLPSGV